MDSIRYDDLSLECKHALERWMICDSDIEDYESHISKFVFRVETIPCEKIVEVLTRWGWNWRPNKSIHRNTEDRVNRIKRYQKISSEIWPYIGGNGKSFGEWSESDMNHGDGWHRMIVAVRRKKPMNFIFLTLDKNR